MREVVNAMSRPTASVHESLHNAFTTSMSLLVPLPCLRSFRRLSFPCHSILLSEPKAKGVNVVSPTRR